MLGLDGCVERAPAGTMRAIMALPKAVNEGVFRCRQPMIKSRAVEMIENYPRLSLQSRV